MYYRLKNNIICLLIVFLFSCREQEPPDPVHTGMENKEIAGFDILFPDSITYFNTTKFEPGRSIILFYYKPSCPYCRMQMRDMVKNIKMFKDLQLCIVTYPDFVGMSEFTKEFQLSKYSNIISGIDTGYAIQRNYGVTAIPFTAIFDKNRRLKSAYLGQLSSNFLLRQSKL